VSFKPAEFNCPICCSHLTQFLPYFFDDECVVGVILKRIQCHLAVCVYGNRLAFRLYVFYVFQCS
jgi:hypothetical protein